MLKNNTKNEAKILRVMLLENMNKFIVHQKLFRILGVLISISPTVTSFFVKSRHFLYELKRTEPLKNAILRT